MSLSTIQILILRLAVSLFFLGIFIAIAEYLIRYGINYYFKMKAMNEPRTQNNQNEQQTIRKAEQINNPAEQAC